MQEFFTDWGGWILGGSILMFVGSLWFASWLIIRLPSDYFLTHEIAGRSNSRLLHYLWLILGNSLGAILVLAGIAMLVLPGQGVIAIVLGLSLMSFPGKRKIIRWILERKSLRRTMNWLRRRAKKTPLVFELNLTGKEPHTEVKT